MLALIWDFPAVLMVGVGLILAQASPRVLLMLSYQLGVDVEYHSWLPEATGAAGDITTESASALQVEFTISGAIFT